MFPQVVPHLGKMFAAVAGVRFGGRALEPEGHGGDAAGCWLQAMVSKEGESVALAGTVQCAADIAEGKPDQPNVKARRWSANPRAEPWHYLPLSWPCFYHRRGS